MCSIRGRSSGFTLVEASIGFTLASIMAVAIGSVLMSGRSATETANSQIDIDAEMRMVAMKLSEEVRWASRLGEDTNGNAALDVGEDQNGNGRLEADWSVSANALTFNRLMADGRFSLPTTFRLTARGLEQVTSLTPAGAPIVTIIAPRVTGFAVSQAGTRVSMALTLSESVRGRTITRSRTIDVTPRN